MEKTENENADQIAGTAKNGKRYVSSTQGKSLAFKKEDQVRKIISISIFCFFMLFASDRLFGQQRKAVENPHHMKADLAVAELVVKPEPPAVGEPAKIVIIVLNFGDESSTRSTIIVLVNGRKFGSAAIRPLDLGGHHKVGFDWTPELPGYTRIVAFLRSGAQVERTIDNNRKAVELIVTGGEHARGNIKITGLKLSPCRPKPGREVSVRVFVKNMAKTGVINYPVRIKIAKRSERLLRVDRLGPGETKELRFTFRRRAGEMKIEAASRLTRKSYMRRLKTRPPTLTRFTSTKARTGGIIGRKTGQIRSEPESRNGHPFLRRSLETS